MGVMTQQKLIEIVIFISISAIDSNNDYEIDFDDYTFADSTPFGVKIEE